MPFRIQNALAKWLQQERWGPSFLTRHGVRTCCILSACSLWEFLLRSPWEVGAEGTFLKPSWS